MKWNEMTTVQKIIRAVGLICGIAYLVLSFPGLRSFLVIPKAALYPLFSVFLISIGLLSSKKQARWFYMLAAGYILLALLYLFFD